MEDVTKTVLRLLFTHVQIPLLLCREDQVIFSLPEGEMLLSEETIRTFLISSAPQLKVTNQPLVIELLPYHLMSVTSLPGDLYLIMGPAVPLRHSDEYIRHLLAEEPYTSCSEVLCRWFSSCPLTSADDFFDALNMAIYLCSGSLPPEELSLSADSTNPVNPDVLRNYSRQTLKNKEEQIFHFSQEFEEGLADAIIKGDFELLKTRSLSLKPGHVGHMSDNAVQKEKYVFTTLAALFSRAAISGGMDSEAAKTLADSYILQADSLQTTADVAQLQIQMTKDFCERVHDLKITSHNLSHTTRICREYISQNLHQPITLTDLAVVCRQNPRAVSARFKADTGMKVTEYIHRMKMNEAAHLLRYTNHSLSMISSMLGYSSQSYFTRIFRQIYQMTPQAYRNLG